MNAPYKERPGFTRVIMPNHPNKPGKTTRIRTKLANDPNYLAKNGMMLMPTPVAPAIHLPENPVIPIPEESTMPDIMYQSPLIPVAPAAPVAPVIEPPTVQTPAPVTEPTKPVTPPTPKAEPMKPTKVKI